MIYLDNSATTYLHPEVREAMLPFFEEEYGNASSVYTLGARARVALEEARETIARYIGAEPREITFTSSGTEANNTAIKGTIFHKLKERVFSEQHIITSQAEHHAVLHPCEFLESLGVPISYLAPDSFGRIEIDAVLSLLQPSTSLISLMLVNNEVGAISPIKEATIAVREKNPKVVVHTDAVQALGKLPVNVRDLNVDLLSLSAHKVHGPKGIGALYTKGGIEWEPMMHGGAQERNRRGGTESVALAVGFAKAVSLLAKEEQQILEHYRVLNDYALAQLENIPQVRLNSARSTELRVPAILNFSFTEEVLQTIDAEALLIRFDLEGIAVSNGSACTSGSMQPSHVLKAMGKGDEVASKSIRISFSRYTTKEEIDRFIEVLQAIIG